MRPEKYQTIAQKAIELIPALPIIIRTGLNSYAMSYNPFDGGPVLCYSYYIGFAMELTADNKNNQPVQVLSVK